MITNDDLLKLLPGKTVIISGCEARTHGDNPGCLCDMKGKAFVVDRLYQMPFVGTPTWHLRNTNKRARLSEMTLVQGALEP